MIRTRRSKVALAVLVALLALTAIPADAPAQTTSPPTSFLRFWGPLWYLRNRTVDDYLTLVHGGVEGSSALLYHDDDTGKTHWIFLEGGNLFLTPGSGMPAGISTTVPGTFITSVQWYSWGTIKETNKRDLSYTLMDVYANSYSPADPLSAIAHVPFLIGKGWGTHGGACRYEAELICAGLGLELEVLSGNLNGYVIEQVSPGGELRDLAATIPDLKVQVKLSASPVVLCTVPVAAAPPAPSGDSWESPVLIEDPDGDGDVSVSTALIGLHTDTRTSPALRETRADVFFQLPATTEEKIVTVRQESGSFDFLILTAWQSDGETLERVPWGGKDHATAAGFRPELRFFCQPGMRTFVMAEHRNRDLGPIHLRFEW